MRIILVYLSLFILLVSNSSCNKVYDIYEGIKKHPKPVEAKTFDSGLVAPLGIESDSKGQLWITEAGSGQSNDGQLTLITPDGHSYPVVKGFTSVVNPEGAVFGLNHLCLKMERYGCYVA